MRAVCGWSHELMRWKPLLKQREVGAILKLIFLHSPECWFNLMCPEMGRKWSGKTEERSGYFRKPGIFQTRVWGTNWYAGALQRARTLLNHPLPPDNFLGRPLSTWRRLRMSASCRTLYFLSAVVGDGQWYQRACLLGLLVDTKVSRALWRWHRPSPGPLGKPAHLWCLQVLAATSVLLTRTSTV